MKLKIMLLSLVFVLGLSLLMTPSIKVNAESIENYEPVLEFYDENNERIYPYSEEELRSIQNILEQDWTIYTFGETQITNTVLIRQGFNFFNPGTILLNTSGTANPSSTVNRHKFTCG